MKPRLQAALIGAMAVISVPLLPTRTECQSRSAAAWRELTLADLEAAHDIIARNHPGAARTTADTAFLRALESGRRAGMERARQVTGYEGWLATLRAFAVGFDDPHISLQPRLSISSVRWPGFLVSRRGDATIVAARDTAGGDVPALGARLLSCDGVAIDEYSRARLGLFRGSWEVAPQRVRNTPLLLVDDANPFLPPANSCVVSEDGAERTYELRWRAVSTVGLQEPLREAAPTGRAGFVVRRAGDGWWIGIESLNARVQAVLDSMAAHAEEIRSAPWVAVDVRGNGGGASEWGRRVAEQLVGAARTQAATRRAERATSGPLCGTSWRVSVDVEETLAGYIRDLGPRLGQRAIDMWRGELDSLRVARDQGRDLAPQPQPCPPPSAIQPEDDSLPASTLAGRLVLVTDHACFSSCLLMAALFRTIGALHGGEGTDFSTRYMEVRSFPLPSGLGRFATLQKVSFGTPPRLGPFEPAVPYPGPIDDTDGLERWVAGLIRDRR